jgi:hypothetical protein
VTEGTLASYKGFLSYLYSRRLLHKRDFSPFCRCCLFFFYFFLCCIENRSNVYTTENFALAVRPEPGATASPRGLRGKKTNPNTKPNEKPNTKPPGIRQKEN